MKKLYRYLPLTAIAFGMGVAPAGAQNPNHAPANLVLTFQNPGGSQGAGSTVMVSLGHSSTLFRDATPGSYQLLLNIGGTLDGAFGSVWFDETTLYMGAAGFRGTSNTSSTLLTLDPHRTIYVTQARNFVGDVGFANSTQVNMANDTGMTDTATRIESMQNVLETSFTTQTAVSPLAQSNVDNQNPFTVPGVQGAAYGNIAGGVQDNFAAGNLGVFGAAGTIELALDLYRIQARNDVAGQYGEGEAIRQGEFMGTLTIAQNGDVGFTAANVIPEPTTTLFLSMAMAGFAFYRPRNKRTA